jgi:hypothetical protein
VETLFLKDASVLGDFHVKTHTALECMPSSLLMFHGVFPPGAAHPPKTNELRHALMFAAFFS